MQANRLRRQLVLGGRTPYFDRNVGRCGDEGAVVLGEDNIVDPVRVRLDLLAELSGWGFEVGGIGVGKRVALVTVGLLQVKMQVPGTDYAIAATRVAMPMLVGHGRFSRGMRHIQDGILGVDGQAIDSESVSSGRVGKWQHCAGMVLVVDLNPDLHPHGLGRIQR